MHAYIHTYIYTYIHAYIHTYTHTFVLFLKSKLTKYGFLLLPDTEADEKHLLKFMTERCSYTVVTFSSDVSKLIYRFHII